jgi:hypothetical protein
VSEIGQKSQRLGIVERGRSIEASGRVVPRSKGDVTTEHLGDRDSLSLSSRNTSHEGVTDVGVGRVLDVEHGEQEVENLLSELGVGDTGNLLSRGLGLERETKRLGDSKSRQVVIVFLVVGDFTDVSFRLRP